MKRNWTPETMFEKLKKSIIGQDEYLKDLCSCIWLHNQRRELFLKTGEHMSNPKFNMLVIGKSGMGKTSTIKEVAALLDIPVVIEDASAFRGAGWKGRQVTEIIRDVLSKVNTDDEISAESASYSIVVLDEIDKIFMKKISADESFFPVNNLLKVIEGTELSYIDGVNTVSMRTDNLLFICIGAFDGLEEIIKKRVSPKRIGFTPDSQVDLEENLLSKVTAEDLTEYGMNEQFLGRLPFVTVMNKLTVDDYKKILLESDISPVKRMDKLLSRRLGVHFSISDKAAEKLSEHVINKSLGARGLHAELINSLKDMIYHMPADDKHNAYRLEYQEDFYIKAISGKRVLTHKQEKAYVLSESDAKKLKVELGLSKEDYENIQIYAAHILETLAVYCNRFMKNKWNSEIDYLHIVKAKFFLSACMTELFLNAHYYGAQKTVLELLNIIKKFNVHKKNECLHPLAEAQQNFLLHVKYLPDDELEEIRKFIFSIVKEYGLKLYELEVADTEEYVYE